jgi:cephalosporin hydroxylase
MLRVLEIAASVLFLLVDTALGVLRDGARIVLAPRSFRAASRNVRFVPFEHRAWFTTLPLSLQFFARVQSRKWNNQADAVPPLNWKGVPCLKDPFDLALYPLLLWDLKPATIIEIGSFAGGSAVWLADLMDAMGVNGRVHSFDIDVSRVVASHDRVTFAYADSNQVSTFPPGLRELPRPWLVIEDAHQNVYGVLRFFDGLLEPGDYLVVEDLLSLPKYAQARRFLTEARGRYAVDTLYTDMFGYNATWNVNGYLKRI